MTSADLTLFMISLATVSVGSAALIAVFGLFALLRFTLGDRWEHRRRRNHRRVISRAKRPVVMLSVRAAKA